MKKIFISMLMAMVAVCTVNAQVDRKAVMKQTKAELNAKATKAARKDAKKYVKEGWQSAPGALPLEKQLDRSYLMQYELDEAGYPRYMMGNAMSIGQNYDAAKMQALELAKQDLAAQVQTEITGLVETSVANNQLDAEEAASITKTVMDSKSLISQSIGRTISVIELFRTLPNKNKEVRVQIAYSSELAKKAALNVLKKELGDDIEKLKGLEE